MIREQITTDIRTVFDACYDSVASKTISMMPKDRIDVSKAVLEATGRIVAAIIKSESKEQ
ncbi:MAG: hypothetical protein ACTSSP_04070 [Candidatus Asgardarchaeia archaeon]